MLYSAATASAVREAMSALRNAAGNFYINDKPTGAVVGQQPFGGARGSGTNDKAGSKLNLVRWVSARTIKETFVPPRDFTYPFMARKVDAVACAHAARAGCAFLLTVSTASSASAAAPTSLASTTVVMPAGGRCGGLPDYRRLELSGSDGLDLVVDGDIRSTVLVFGKIGHRSVRGVAARASGRAA